MHNNSDPIESKIRSQKGRYHSGYNDFSDPEKNITNPSSKTNIVNEYNINRNHMNLFH